MKKRMLKHLCVAILLCAPALPGTSQNSHAFIYSHGAIVRGDTAGKNIALVFTADEFADGGNYIVRTLKNRQVRASFFLTGNFYRNSDNKDLIRAAKKNGHYLGSHSNRHLLYCSWENRDSLLVTEKEFNNDLADSFTEMAQFGIAQKDASYFMPPYEWYNDTIAAWSKQLELQLINFTHGTRSNADYTYPEMAERYVRSEDIMQSILNYESRSPGGLNGFILLIHLGTDPRRTDKFYYRLPDLIKTLRNKGYRFLRVDEMLGG